MTPTGTVKLTDLSDISTISDDDIMLFTDNPSGAPASKKGAWSLIKEYILHYGVHNASALSSLASADEFLVLDASAGYAFKKVTLGNVYSSLPPTVTYYTAAGSGTYTTPADCVALDVEIWGGGAAGAGSISGTNASVGCGGSGGGYSRKLIITPAASYSYAVGAGGTAIAGAAGLGGQSTYFGTQVATGAAAPTAPMANGTTVGSTVPAAAGSAANGDLNLIGGVARDSQRFSGTQALGGDGGKGAMGGDGGRGGPISGGAGAGGAQPGGGGGGGVTTAGVSVGGGAGAVGLIIIREYYK